MKVARCQAVGAQWFSGSVTGTLFPPKNSSGTPLIAPTNGVGDRASGGGTDGEVPGMG